MPDDTQNSFNASLFSCEQYARERDAINRIPIFSGDGKTTFSEFSQKVRRFTPEFPVGSDLKGYLKSLVGRLEGSASKLVEREMLTSVDHLLEILGKEYRPRHSFMYYVSKIKGMHMKTREGIKAFYSRLEDILDDAKESFKINPTYDADNRKTDVDALQRTAVLVFYKNIPDRAKKYLDGKKPKTLREAFKLVDSQNGGFDWIKDDDEEYSDVEDRRHSDNRYDENRYNDDQDNYRQHNSRSRIHYRDHRDRSYRHSSPKVLTYQNNDSPSKKSDSGQSPYRRSASPRYSAEERERYRKEQEQKMKEIAKTVVDEALGQFKLLLASVIETRTQPGQGHHSLHNSNNVMTTQSQTGHMPPVNMTGLPGQNEYANHKNISNSTEHHSVYNCTTVMLLHRVSYRFYNYRCL